ncbi:MAG: 2TM domain-containing protein [Acidimicrobiales bacterium]|nr:2TM domain-containing protein [Acidimicrobiales bacterium]
MLPVERQDRLQRIARDAYVVHARTYVLVNVFLVFVWLMAGAGPFWPAWVILGWGLALVFHSLATFSRHSNS